MRIAVLTENTACRSGIGHEHGLSLYIESCGSKVLFDFGQSDLFLANAGALGIDLSEVDFGVLSHGHYDHGGGIRTFLEVNSRAPVFLGRAAFEKHYNKARKDIGLDEGLKSEERLVPLSGEYQAAPGIRIFHCNERRPVTPIEPFGLSVLKENAFIPEDFRHEQYLEITEEEKKVLFSGCSHKGILNITEWTKPDVLVGGFHLMKVDMDDEGKKKLKGIAERLLSGHTRYYTCHCTGSLQYDYLKQIMGDRLNYISAGMEVDI